MKRYPSLIMMVRAAVLFAFLLLTGIGQAQTYKLFGISGKQQADQVSPGVYTHKDHTLFQIDTGTALLTEKIRMTWVPDSDAVGYCSLNGLIYHTASGNAYRDDPTQNLHDQDPAVQTLGGAYQDNTYMENFNLLTLQMTGVYNANPCPNPDNAITDIGADGIYLPCFGLAAPIPPWVFPQYRRDSTMTDPTNRVTGPNEASAIRGLAWSTELNSWFVSDGNLFKMSFDGMTNTKLSTPAFIIPTDTPGVFQTNTDLKAVAFINVNGTNKLFGTYRNDSETLGNTNGWIMEIDTVTGTNKGQIALNYPPGGSFHTSGSTGYEFGGLLGLAQNPQTGVIYGIRKTDDAYARELVTIDLSTGNTTLVGTGILTDGAYGQAITTLAFVPDILITSITNNSGTLTITWTGAAAPTFTLQTTASLTPPVSWSTVATGLSGPSTTTSITNSLGFFRISKP